MPSAQHVQLFVDDSHGLDRFLVYTFIRLKPGTPTDGLDKKLTASLDKQLGEPAGNMAKAELQLQPIGKIHTSGGYDLEMGKAVSGFFLALLIGLAALIQLIACINFMNLSTARASRRAREVGVRKIIGADNKGLVLQVLVESCICLCRAGSMVPALRRGYRHGAAGRKLSSFLSVRLSAREGHQRRFYQSYIRCQSTPFTGYISVRAFHCPDRRHDRHPSTT
jgi:hypothetical protein